MSILDDSPSNATEFTVSEIAGAVKRTVEDAFGHVRVRGEVGRLSRPNSGHVYFDLKDDNAVLSAVAWKGVVNRWQFMPEQGLEVIATGKLTTFPGQSRYQIIIEKIEPAGAGALMALLEERRKKLAGEGLFDDARKQLLPFMPKVIGVITSPSGAVIRDILHRLDDRFPLHVIVWPVRVQGETCGKEVTNAINGFNAFAADGPIKRPDLIIVARGGGSLEDLWGFNDEIVVRAAAGSDIPLISAVGHETDWTLIDHAADQRAPTPTGAAEVAVPVKAELQANLSALAARLRGAQGRSFQRNRDGLRALSRALPTLDSLMAVPRQRLDRTGDLLGKALVFNTANHRRRFDRQAVRIAPNALFAAIREKRLTVIDRTTRNRNAINRLGERRRALLDRSKSMLASLPRRIETMRVQQAGRVVEAMRRHEGAINRLVGDHRRTIETHARMLGSLSYSNVLRRGFVLVRNSKGNLVAKAGSVARKETVSLQFSDGTIAAITTGEKPRGPETGGTVSAKRKAGTKAAPVDDSSTKAAQKSFFD